MKKSYKVSPRLLLYSIIALALPFSLYAEKNLNIPLIGYTDETIGVLCFIIFFYYLLKGKLKGSDIAIFVFTTITAIFGLIGNYTYRLIGDWFPVAVDTVCLYKIFMPFIVYKTIAKSDKDALMMKYLAPISKLFLMVVSVFGIISQFVDIGMTENDTRYGIHAYTFLFDNCGRYGYIVAIALLTILFSEHDITKLRFYEALAVFNMILTTKGVVYIVLGSYIILAIMWRKKAKLNIRNIIFLALGGLGISTVQINSYIRDRESPRMTLIKYGYITAQEYFPFGSGFSTYGSDMAAKNYSVLYYRYGFNERYGLSEEFSFALNDCYLGMMLGQFGFVGSIFYMLILASVFIPIKNIIINRKVKALTIAIFIGVVISAIGTAIIKSSIGVYIFIFLGMVCGYSGIETEREKYLRTAENPDAKKIKFKVKLK